MLRVENTARVLPLIFAMILAGCPYTVTGHRWSVNANISPRPIEPIRARVLALGGFEGPLNITAASVCLDSKYYDKILVHSELRVSVYDCYGQSSVSETGWSYFVAVASHGPDLKPDARNEIETLVEEIRKAVQDAVGEAKVTITEKETGYGFSLLPY
jgi:hypothetical protein